MHIWLFKAQEKPCLAPSIEAIPKDAFVWIHAEENELDAAYAKAEQLTHVIIHEQHRQDCSNIQHPSSFDSVTGYDLLILRSLGDIGIDTCSENTRQNSFFIQKHLLLSIASKSKTINMVHEKLQTHQLRMQFTQDNLLYYILKLITDDFLALRKPLANQLLEWQETLLNETRRFKRWHELMAFKNQLRWLSMLMEEQQAAIDEWEADIASEITDFMSVKINDLQEHTLRVLKTASRMEKELESLIQLHYTMLSKNTNDVMKTLTLISAIFLPLTLITGFFGMNFERMPFISSIQGFYLTCLVIVLLPVAMIAGFRWRNWL